MSTKAAATSPSGLDPYSSDALRAPYSLYRTLRGLGPTTYLPERNIWLVPGYEQAAGVLRDHRRFVSRLGVGYTRVPDHGYRFPLVDTDPPDHTRIRRAVQGQFNRAAMEELRRGVRSGADELVRAAVEAGEIDGVPALARPLPDLTIRLLTGIKPPDDDTIAAWGDAVGQLAAPDLAAEHVRLAVQSLDWLTGEGLAAVPPHCMARLIMESGGDTGGLAEHGTERLMTLDSIWLAGIDSSVSLLGNAINAFTQFPEQWDVVRAHPEAIPNAVEELMRWDSPFRTFYRRTLDAADIGGVPVPADADICVMLASANRDPATFADPDRFDVLRTNARTHLALGTSIHLCLGAPVARLETTELIGALARRVRRLERTGEAVRADSQTMRKFSVLPVRLIPA